MTAKCRSVNEELELLLSSVVRAIDIAKFIAKRTSNAVLINSMLMLKANYERILSMACDILKLGDVDYSREGCDAPIDGGDVEAAIKALREVNGVIKQCIFDLACRFSDPRSHALRRLAFICDVNDGLLEAIIENLNFIE